MSGPVPRPLTVAETDGNPTVRPTNEIAFNAAQFVVADQGGGTVRVDTLAGGTAASLTDTYIGFGDSSNELTGSSDFTFTADTGSAGPIVLLTGNKPIWRLQDDTDATDYKSSWEQSGNSLYLYNGDSTGNNYEVHRISPSYVWWNRGNANLDMYYDSANVEKFFTIDVGQDNAGIGGTPDSDVESLHVKGTGTGTLVRLESTDTGSSDAPILELYRNSASPAIGDNLGQILWSGEKSDGSRYAVTKMYAEINTPDNSDRLIFNIASSGGAGLNSYEYLRFDGGVRTTIFNELGYDINLKMESQNEASMFFLDASQDNIGIGGTPDSDVERLHIKGTGTGNLVMLESTDDGASASPDLVFYRNSASPADDDYISQTDYVGRNDNSQDVTYFKTQARIVDASDGSEDGGFYTYVMKAGTLRRVITLTSGGMYVNNDGYDFNFAVNDDQDDALLNCDAGLRKVGVGNTTLDSDSATLQVDSGTGRYALDLISSQTDANGGPHIRMYRDSGSPAPGDDIAHIDFIGKDDGGNDTTYAQISAEISDETGSTEDGWLRFGAAFAGVLQPNMLTIRGDVPEVVVNEGSGDVNLRVESNANTHMLFVDGGQNRVSIGGGPTSGGATFQVNDNTISSYCNVNAVRADGVATQVFTNNDCQGQLWVNDSATDWTLLLPEGGIKGQWFQFVSTNGQMDLDPQGTDTVNGSTSTFSRDTDYEIYTVVCYDTGKWLVTNPN